MSRWGAEAGSRRVLREAGSGKRVDGYLRDWWVERHRYEGVGGSCELRRGLDRGWVVVEVGFGLDGGVMERGCGDGAGEAGDGWMGGWR